VWLAVWMQTKVRDCGLGTAAYSYSSTSDLSVTTAPLRRNMRHLWRCMN